MKERQASNAKTAHIYLIIILHGLYSLYRLKETPLDSRAYICSVCSSNGLYIVPRMIYHEGYTLSHSWSSQTCHLQFSAVLPLNLRMVQRDSIRFSKVSHAIAQKGTKSQITLRESLKRQRPRSAIKRHLTGRL